MVIYEENLLPENYKKQEEPIFKGRGNHTMKELEEIAEAYKELVNQMRIREDIITKKANVVIMDKPNLVYSQEVKYFGSIYYILEEKNGYVLIATDLDLNSDNYNDWWVSVDKIEIL